MPPTPSGRPPGENPVGRVGQHRRGHRRVAPASAGRADPTAPARPRSAGNSQPTSYGSSPWTATQRSAGGPRSTGSVGRVGLEQLGDLVDEELEDRLDVELAGDDLGRVEQRALLREPHVVLPQEARGVDASPSSRATASASAISPAVHRGVAPVQAEHPDFVEDDDRRGQRRAGAEPAQVLQVLTLELRLDVRDRGRPPASAARFDDRQPLRVGVADRRQPFGRPLGLDRQALAYLAEADEAPRGPDGARQLLDRDVQERLEVELRPHFLGDRRDQPLAIQRLLERQRGPRALLERNGRLGRERSRQDQLLRRERARRSLDRRDGEHADHPLAGDERDESGAVRADRLGDGLLDQR